MYAGLNWSNLPDQTDRLLLLAQPPSLPLLTRAPALCDSVPVGNELWTSIISKNLLGKERKLQFFEFGYILVEWPLFQPCTLGSKLILFLSDSIKQVVGLPACFTVWCIHSLHRGWFPVFSSDMASSTRARSSRSLFSDCLAIEKSSLLNFSRLTLFLPGLSRFLSVSEKYFSPVAMATGCTRGDAWTSILAMLQWGITWLVKIVN